MARLASPIENLKSHYQIVVIGSGYGGGITASRLARAGQQVCVLERGREFQPGEYPNTLPHVVAEAQIDTAAAFIGSRTGLYDFRVNDDINVFCGCGLGGTSLVNANVSLPPEPRVFDDLRWPAGIRADIATALADGYTRAGEMLKPQPYPDAFPALPKLQALEKSAGALGQNFYRPPINVTFQDGVNHVGVDQQACKLCGDCVTGCNFAAKNTILMNYLPDAANHGAEIYTEIAVRQLERQGDGWVVHYQLLDSGREAFDAPTLFLTADIVVLSGGVLGSSEVLLRSRAAGLPVSDQLGFHFTGNGDVLGFGYDGNDTIDGIAFGNLPPDGRAPVGPCIAGIIDMRNQPAVSDGLVVEEGSIPGALGSLIGPTLSLVAPWFGKNLATDVPQFAAQAAREADSLFLGPYHGAVQNTQTYLIMSHDDEAGQLALENDRVRIHWPGAGSQPVFAKDSDVLNRATVPLGGVYLKNPLWSPLTNNNLTTVHPLGGCVMADDSAHGVVNHKGQVFTGADATSVYNNLYISDGSVVPLSLGVNPLLTISALAERCCACIAQDNGWTIDYTLPSAPAAAPGPPLKTGMRFTETMKGFISTKVTGDFQKGFDQGQADNSTFEFTLTVVSDDLNDILDNPDHPARLVGTATAPALSAEAMTGMGQFQLLVRDPSRVNTRLMTYAMKMTTEEGKTCFLYGTKVVGDDGLLNIWRDTSTLFTTVYGGDSASAPVLATGILHIEIADFMRQMTTMEITNAPTVQDSLTGLLRFGAFFGQSLFDVYGAAVALANEFNASPAPRTKRTLRLCAPELHYFETTDSVELRLTRYKGGTKGPVILSPGYGTSTLAYLIDTVDTNLPEYLYANGYDVWLFDYRASPALAASKTQFTFDDIATKDYSAAVALVRQVTGAATVQVMVHCIGSMTFLMSMLSGTLDGVRSAVCSQLGLFPLSSPANRLKAAFDVGNFFKAIGIDILTTDFNPANWGDIITDGLLKIDPAGPPCNSAVCRRIWLIYGVVYDHDNLNDDTHNAIHEMFGVGNITAYSHLLLMIRKGQIVDKDGNDAYLPNISRLKIPITFLQGALNPLLIPEGTEKSLDLLASKNGADGYRRIVFPSYGHMDHFIGKNAAIDIYPTILGELDVYNS